MQSGDKDGILLQLFLIGFEPSQTGLVAAPTQVSEEKQEEQKDAGEDC